MSLACELNRQLFPKIFALPSTFHIVWCLGARALIEKVVQHQAPVKLQYEFCSDAVGNCDIVIMAQEEKSDSRMMESSSIADICCTNSVQTVTTFVITFIMLTREWTAVRRGS